MTPDIEIILKKKDNKDVYTEQYNILIDELAFVLEADPQKIKDIGILDTKLSKNKAIMKFWYAGLPRFTIEITETWRTVSYAFYKHFNGLLG